jgi:hypothetical protein
MDHDSFLVAFERFRWVLSRDGVQLGTFRFRASALKGAIEALHWGSASSEHVGVMVLEPDGSLYTAWRSRHDQLTLVS